MYSVGQIIDVYKFHDEPIVVLWDFNEQRRQTLGVDDASSWLTYGHILTYPVSLEGVAELGDARAIPEGRVGIIEVPEIRADIAGAAIRVHPIGATQLANL